MSYIINRFNALSAREKAITAFTLVLLFIFGPYILLYSPSAEKLKAKKYELHGLKTEIKALTAELELRRAAAEIKPEVFGIPEASDLSGMLASITRQASTSGVDFIAISPESVNYREDLVELKLKLELRSGFRELFYFLERLNTGQGGQGGQGRQGLFIVQDIRYETNDAIYPSGVAIIKAVTYLKKK